MDMIEATLKAAKAAKAEVAALDAARKNAALCAMADALITNQAAILDANAADMAAAAGTISDVMLDRLRLTGERIAGMAQGIRDVSALPDPVGRVLEEHTRSDGLNIRKVAVPMGVVAIIYSAKVSQKFSEGDLAAAEHYSEVSAWWCIGTIVGGIILSPIVSLIQMALLG